MQCTGTFQLSETRAKQTKPVDINSHPDYVIIVSCHVTYLVSELPTKCKCNTTTTVQGNKCKPKPKQRKVFGGRGREIKLFALWTKLVYSWKEVCFSGVVEESRSVPLSGAWLQQQD